MCPMCWATALATFACFFGISLVLVAGSDLFVLVIAGVLSGTALLHKLEETVWLPWWWYVVVASILTLRVLYIGFVHRDRLLVVHAWNKAKAVSRSRCKTVPIKQ
ncbi:hypothetical protein PLANPX_3793 [Lacipirellula parvula]|uniref:Uncharacterized protein n=1 Tax=Lacipirellula parvula TaxID=2650471 RepID=A0A5K7XGW7_9BACT|nr:hypothetical protein PLANPX_3793 [Lacipirellula parvula]